MQRAILTVIVVVFMTNVASGDVRIQQSLSATHALLGEPLYWTIRIYHPLWEKYSARPNQSRGLHVGLQTSWLETSGDGLCTAFRLKLVPDALGLSDSPSVLISDQRGQASMLTAKPIRVESITGSSTEIKEPGQPHFPVGPFSRRALVFALSVLFVAIIVGAVRYYRHLRSPRQMLLRELAEARRLIGQRKFTDFSSLSVLFRSALLWSFPSEARTAAELQAAAGARSRLLAIADGVEVLERWRYSRLAALPPPAVLEASLDSAISLLKERPPS